MLLPPVADTMATDLICSFWLFYSQFRKERFWVLLFVPVSSLQGSLVPLCAFVTGVLWG